LNITNTCSEDPSLTPSDIFYRLMCLNWGGIEKSSGNLGRRQIEREGCPLV
jgi:hypothetical protein